MPRLVEHASLITLGTLVVVANAVHPLIHSAEGGSLDAALDYANTLVINYLNGRNNV